MKSETPMEGGATSSLFHLGKLRRSSKSHPRTEYSQGLSSLSLGRARSSGRDLRDLRDPRLLDLQQVYQGDRSDTRSLSSLSSQTSLLSDWSQPGSLASSDVKTVGRYQIKWSSDGIDRNDDAMSIASQNTQLSYPATGFNEGLKRKFSSIAEAISDSDDDLSFETVAKRPRTPIPSSDTDFASDESKMSIFFKIKTLIVKLLLVIFKFGVIFSCLFVTILCYTGFKNYQCSQLRSQSLDPALIEAELGRQTFGQDSAVQQIVTALRQFSLQANGPEHRKLLLLPFIGWVGVGKTHTATILSHLLPCNHNTHFISCPLISLNLIRTIREKTSLSCGHSLVVLDDCDLKDKMVEDFIRSLVMELDQMVERKSSGTILIITTSTGARIINREVGKHLKAGRSLPDLKPSDLLDHLVEEPSLNFVSELSSKSVMTEPVPFLPLSRASVRECVEKLAKEQNLRLSNSQTKAVLDLQHLMVAGEVELVTTGCKQVVSKLDIVRGGVPDREL